MLGIIVVGFALSALAAASRAGGPLSLPEQRQAAQQASFTIVKPPDAPREGEPPTVFNDEAKKAGAAVFVRDYNLPVYPEHQGATYSDAGMGGHPGSL
jgi:hypothetical protein